MSKNAVKRQAATVKSVKKTRAHKKKSTTTKLYNFLARFPYSTVQSIIRNVRGNPGTIRIILHQGIKAKKIVKCLSDKQAKNGRSLLTFALD